MRRSPPGSGGDPRGERATSASSRLSAYRHDRAGWRKSDPTPPFGDARVRLERRRHVAVEKTRQLGSALGVVGVSAGDRRQRHTSRGYRGYVGSADKLCDPSSLRPGDGERRWLTTGEWGRRGAKANAERMEAEALALRRPPPRDQ